MFREKLAIQASPVDRENQGELGTRDRQDLQANRGKLESRVRPETIRLAAPESR